MREFFAMLIGWGMYVVMTAVGLVLAYLFVTASL